MRLQDPRVTVSLRDRGQRSVLSARDVFLDKKLSCSYIYLREIPNSIAAVPSER